MRIESPQRSRPPTWRERLAATLRYLAELLSSTPGLCPEAVAA